MYILTCALQIDCLVINKLIFIVSEIAVTISDTSLPVFWDCSMTLQILHYTLPLLTVFFYVFSFTIFFDSSSFTAIIFSF